MKRSARAASAAIVLALLVAVPSVAMAILPPPPADGAKVVLSVGESPWEVAVYQYPVGSGPWYLDASVANNPWNTYSSGVNVVRPMVTIDYRSSSDVVLGRETFSVPAFVMPFYWQSPLSLPDGYYRYVHHRLTLPAGADPARTRFTPEVNPVLDPEFPKYRYGIAASTATFSGFPGFYSTVDYTLLGGGRSTLQAGVTNTGSRIVGPISFTGNETYEEGPGDWRMLDTFDMSPVDPVKASRLAPGETAYYTLRGLAATPSGKVRSGPQNLQAEAYPLSDTTVYRFYNLRTGAHFYTASVAERDLVLATWPTIFRDEATAYGITSANPSNNTPLYRFYNLRTGAHFYTADEDEKNAVMANWPTIFRPEGVAYYVSSTSASAEPVFRFYNLRTGAHFYTASVAERDLVLATWPTIFRDEGAVFYLAHD